MDELSISSISNSAMELCSLEKLTASVSPLFTGFYHPKTSYDAFLNPASSSSYYPILCSSSKQNLSPNFTTFAISIYDLS